MDGGRGHDGVMTSRVRAYYHVYAESGRWAPIVRRHLEAMQDAEIDWDLVVGIVGKPDRVEDVRANLPTGTRVHAWDEGFEQQTLNLICDDLDAGFDGPILYAHTKGAARPDRVSAQWRTCMTRIVREAKVSLDHLAEGADTVGCHWLCPEDWPNVPDIVDRPFYGGNFWWATSDHLRKQGRPGTQSRFEAERWIGTVPPANPVNLVPGWPGPGCKNHI